MTRTAISVSMNSWTPEAVRALMHQFDDGAAELTPTKRKTRDRILQAATGVFVQFGYRRANMEDIARAAAVGKGTIYLYFSSKSELLIAAITREKMQMLPELERIVGLSPAERLPEFLLATLRFSFSAPLSARLMQADSELAILWREYGEERGRAEQEPGLDLLLSMIQAANPALDDDAAMQVALTLSALLANASRMTDILSMVGADVDATAPLLARILAGGIAGLDGG